MNALDELREVLPPPKRPFCATGDWTAVEASLGTPLPSDYKAFIATYGAGDINNCLVINSPFVWVAFGRDIRQAWANWALMYQDFAEYAGIEIPYPVFPAAGGLLPFGSLGDVDFLNWRTDGEPDSWPFVYYNREEGFFEVKGLSAVEFVLEAVTRRSLLLIRLRDESGFDPPCEFEAYTANPQVIEMVCAHPVELDQFAERLASRWSAGQVQLRRWPSRVKLLVEPLAGKVNVTREEGDERTFLRIDYDRACEEECERLVRELGESRFTELRRY